MSGEVNEHNKRGRAEESAPEDTLLTKIIDFDERWTALASQVYAKELAQQQRAIEVRNDKIISLQENFNYLYIEQLHLLREQGTVLPEVYKLNHSLNAALKDVSPEFVDLHEEFKILREVLCVHLTHMGREMMTLVARYRRNDQPDFKEAVHQALAEQPELMEWIDPFFNSEEGVDPLQQAVNGLIKRQKIDELEVLLGVYDSQVEAQLPQIKAHVQKHLDAIIEFEEKLQQNPHRTYAQKVQLYADYCASTFKSILETLSVLQGPLRLVDKCLAQLDDDSAKQRMEEAKNVLTHMRKDLITEVETLCRVMAKLATQYNEHERNLGEPLKRFMKPWVEFHDCPLNASIQALDATAMPTVIVEKEPSVTASFQMK
ncbi:MAG TPA: hypothetical protein VGV92_04095 [Gammaproteobacteria bacterium]|nr:hypothetical protein [Gammaproteobacteria bacterium]